MGDLEKFVEKRPEAKAAFGYGSAIFKQEGYDENSEPQHDIIFIVKDIKKWHLENMQINPKDYSFLGRLHLTAASKERIKGLNKITYVSQIKEGEHKFKYGVIEEEDFVSNLSTWENLFVVGRFQKPTYKINSTNRIDAVIKYDQSCAFRIACLLVSEETDLANLFRTLCSLSYIGDTRMGVAENPNKVANIVNGSYELLKELYLPDKDYITVDGDKVIIDQKRLLREINLLPATLVYYLAEHDTNLSDVWSVKNNIYEFFREKNKKESFYQTLDVLRTNGIVRSVPYVLSKVNKRIRGK